MVTLTILEARITSPHFGPIKVESDNPKLQNILKQTCLHYTYYGHLNCFAKHSFNYKVYPYFR